MNIEEAIKVAQMSRSAGDAISAEKAYRQILAVAPEHLEALNGLGMCLGETGRLTEAREVFDRILAIDSSLCEAWFNLGLTRQRLEDYDGATAACRKALKLKGDSAEYWRCLGINLEKNGERLEAITALRKAIDLSPYLAGVRRDLVAALCAAKQFEAAADAAFAPPAFEAPVVKVVADALNDLGRFEESSAIWERAAEAAPWDADARVQWATSLIGLGDYERGWSEYETRWLCRSQQSENIYLDPQRQWGIAPTGHPDVAGKTLFLYSEQGLGDTLQFIRYAAVLAKRAARVIVGTPWPLKPLMQLCAGVRLAYSHEDNIPNYDWHIPMLSAPAALGTTIQTVPCEIPYIQVDANRAKSWSARVAAASPAGTIFRVGIAWAGNPRNPNDDRRSIPPEMLDVLRKVGAVAFFNLQKSPVGEKFRAPPKELRLIDFTSSLHDFAETAALIAQLDLVISADTAVAHLTGGLGKPVWTMLPFVADPRWGVRGKQTPWYPNMTLFRQSALGDWAGVINEVTKALDEALTANSEAPRGPA